MGKKRYLMMGLLIFLMGCSGNKSISEKSVSEKSYPENTIEKVSAVKEEKQENAVVKEKVGKTQEELIDDYLKNMTIEEKVGQLFMVAIRKDAKGEDITAIDNEVTAILDDYKVGGVILFKENIKDEEQVKTLIDDLQAHSDIPLFIGVDEEGGTVSRVGSNPKINKIPFKEAFAIGKTGDAKVSYQEAERMGKLLKSLGFNMDFAPDADIYNEPQNTVIGRRSFGRDSETVTPMMLAFVKGLQDQGIMTVVKHFPGHGNTKEDSHSGLAYVDKSLASLEKEELIPFMTAIDEGADGVMKGHLLAGAVDADYPASLSSKWQDYLERKKDVSQVLLVTDALNMGAIVQHYTSDETAKLSISAGNDILLMPQDLEKAYEGIMAALKSGELTEERIDQSVRKILSKKIAQNMLVLS